MQNRPTRVIFAALFALTAGTAVACVDDADTIEDGDLRIINGDPATSNVTEYEATVGIHAYYPAQSSASASPFCSGTLISDEVVMTAAHCCDGMSANGALVYFGEGPAHDGTSWTGDLFLLSEMLMHPSYNSAQLNNDICLLRLASPNTDVTPIPHLPAAQGVTSSDVGTILDHVGFGYSNLAKTEYGVKLHAEVPISEVSSTKIAYVQDGDPNFGPCNGDSGGPAFIERNGSTYVAGITSYGDSACIEYGVSTNVSAYDSWINDFIGGDDGGSDDGGSDDGGGESSCGDGVCDVGESCDGRYQTTACSSDCPGKTKGKPSSRYCYVDGVCEGPGC
ncbi:trypsin-like serine protease [Pseudenhygromyxa sp. WMMC2535]|uniref:S1 family peptidase n=1 Tax=Pseudenhygromyxa sp. WMMC2535 TaxID=2712867 RepID=UPI0015558EEA|nr:trypsin-like serine protease [Pseudenhygromyxa sp. WMMC2535]NVB37639.1 trypsin-like serine protease [Pseudenhygromyxa sp. WMMC2535]